MQPPRIKKLLQDFGAKKKVFPSLRLGQYFINTYLSGIADPDLFHASDEEAKVMIEKMYNDYQWGM